EDGIRDFHVTGVQTCALPISALNAVSAFLTSAGVRASSRYRTGRFAASPRSGYGSRDGSVTHVEAAPPPGRTPSHSPGTATVSHSRPFAACTVITWTTPLVSLAPSTTRPRSRSAADSR